MLAICIGLCLRRNALACTLACTLEKNHSATYVLDTGAGFFSVMPSLQYMPYLGQVHLRTIEHSNILSDARENIYAFIKLCFLL